MTRGVSHNFVLNVAGSLLPLLTALITVPLYIAQIGAARYGILAVVWIFLGYFGLLDFGLTRASANALSKLGDAGPARRGPVIVTALCLNAALGTLGGIVLYAASGLLFARFSTMAPELQAEVTASMPWIAAMLPVSLVSYVGSGALESREKFLASNIFTTVGGVLGQALPVTCAILFGPSLTVVIPAAFAARVIGTVAVLAYVRHIERPLSLRSVSGARARELLGYGAWVSVSSGISPVMETFDQILIATLLGPAAVAHYSVPMSVATRAQVASTALQKTLFPRLSRLPLAEARALARRGFVTLAFGFGALCGPAIVLAGPLLRLWVGAEFAEAATPVAQILLVGTWANGMAGMPFVLLLGQGRPDVTAKIHAVEVLPFLAVLYGLILAAGLPGAALAWSLRTGIDCVVMIVFARCYAPSMRRALVAAALMAICFACARTLPGDLVTSGLAAAGLGVAFLAAGLTLDPALRAAARGALVRATCAARVPDAVR